MMNIDAAPQERGARELPKLTFQAAPRSELVTRGDWTLAACRDQLSFFEKLLANRPAGASLLDFEHQALLRRLSIAEPLSFQTLTEYFSDEGRRQDLLREAIARESKRLSEIEDLLGEPSGDGAAHSDDRVFNNRFGFARFLPGVAEEWNGQLVENLRTSSMSSVGAGIYFCFNVVEHSDRIFLQETSVSLLAQTMAYYAEVGIPPMSRNDDRHQALCAAVRESFAEPIRQRDEIFHATKDFLVRHEIGHGFGSSASCPVGALIREATGSLWEPVPVAFPTDHQLGAWGRIKRGEGSVDDICFVFGDFIANVVAYQSGLSESSVGMLKAFHWWIVPPASETRMPRGGAVFLKLLYDQNLQGIMSDLGKLFSAAVNDPSTVGRLMVEMERASWNWLRSEVLR